MLNSLSTCVVLEEIWAQASEYLVISLQANFGAEEFYIILVHVHMRH